jgi:hypothetical protein
MNLLPQVRSEDLDQTDLQGRDLAVHEHTGQIKLDLETNVDIGSVNGGRPPHGETTIRDLGQTGSLSVCELFELHPDRQQPPHDDPRVK